MLTRDPFWHLSTCFTDLCLYLQPPGFDDAGGMSLPTQEPREQMYQPPPHHGSQGSMGGGGGYEMQRTPGSKCNVFSL